MISPPGEPRGDGADAKWFRHLIQYVKSIAIKEGIGYQRNITSEGTSLIIGTGGGGSPTEVAVERFIVVSVSGDYVTADRADGSESGVKIAKPYKLQRSPWDGNSAIIDGNAIHYTYNTDVKRTATTSGGLVEIQVVVPRYLVDDEIFACQADTGVSGVEWQDLNADGRAWARKYQQDI